MKRLLLFLLVAGCGGNNNNNNDQLMDPVEFAISGTVQGLSGGGLTLANGTARVTINAGATSFAFSGKFAADSPYTVDVATQPTSPSQTCTIANGTGVLHADVSNVAVQCTTRSFPISVSIMGLEGTGLQLRNNGGDALPVTAGTAVATFATLVQSGGAFDVTIQSQPSGQTCEVAGGTGNVANGPVSTVVVNCTTHRTVGGTVTRLLGTGLNVQETVAGVAAAINMNGAFAFAHTYLAGNNYSASITAQPTSPAQTCTLTNGSGTVGNGDVTAIAIDCACDAPASTYCTSGAGAACINTNTDINNCGACGRTCSGSSSCNNGQCSGVSTFNFTGGIQTFTVPENVTQIFIQTWGAQGGSGATGGNSAAGGSGGLGGYAEGRLAVTPGQVLNIFVGGQGATPTGGFNGGANGGSQNAGGGGGASDVRVNGTAEANRVIVGGGGGGGGRAGCETNTVGGGQGGSGGGGVGANGTDAPTSGGVAGGGRGGNFGGVAGAGGSRGIGCAGFLGVSGITATTGAGAVGGAGQSCCCFTFGSIPGGGGGGGGFIGGGGGGGGSAGTTGCSGNDKGAGGGGGGGSSNLSGVTNGAVNPGIWLGNGMVTISW